MGCTMTSRTGTTVVALHFVFIACTGETPPPTGVGGSSANNTADCGLGGRGSTLWCANGQEACTELIILDQPCAFTQAEALAGIDIGYQVVTTEPVNGVVPEPLDSSGCGVPGESGLIVFEELSSTTNGNENYCFCDLGSCTPEPPAPLTLPVGTFESNFSWDGRSFNGPGDANLTPGEPFPPGLYVLSLRAAGQQEIDGARTTFEVGASMTLRILPD